MTMASSKAFLLAFALGLASGCASAPPPAFRGLDVSSGQAIAIQPNAARAYPLAGVYRSPQLGLVRLWQRDGRVLGRFEYARGRAAVQGTLAGQIEGNLLRFDWLETQRTCAGTPLPPGPFQGRGYFLYDPPQGDQARPRLFGHREYWVLVEVPPRGVHAVAIRDGGALSATRLDREPPTAGPACPAPQKE